MYRNVGLKYISLTNTQKLLGLLATHGNIFIQFSEIVQSRAHTFCFQEDIKLPISCVIPSIFSNNILIIFT